MDLNVASSPDIYSINQCEAAAPARGEVIRTYQRRMTGAMRTHICHALLGTAQVLQYVPPITTVLDTLVAQHYLSRPRRQCESRALQCSLQFESHSADIENGLFKIHDRCQNHKLTIQIIVTVTALEEASPAQPCGSCDWIQGNGRLTCESIAATSEAHLGDSFHG